VYSMCTTGLLTLFASSTPLSSLCLSLCIFKLDLGLAVFFFPRNLRRKWGNGNCVYRVTTWKVRFPASLC
jgi:hypothetical protein